MASSLQQIGLGSDNKLSLDIINQLKDVDKSNIIDPIDADISTTEEKKTTLSEITSLMEELQTSTSQLAEDSLYLNRTAQVSSEGIGVEIQPGVQTQSISIEVSQLAQEEVIQSATFSSRTDTIASQDGTITIELNGVSQDFDVTTNTTLEDLMQMINDSSLDAKAKILNTGENEYRLVLSGNSTGESNSFSITESDGVDTALSDSANIVQEAQDAQFTYNGIGITRSSNQIDDLVTGLTLTLNQTTTQPINIDIVEDVNSVTTQIQSFVESYNKLIDKIDDATKFDEATKESGVFQGNSDINSIIREINKLLLKTDSKGNSMVDYGFSFDKTGKLSFDASQFSTKYSESPEDVQYFLQGDDIESRGVTSHPDGLFYKLDETLDRYVGLNGSLQTFSTSLENQEKRLNEEREKALKLLDKRYDLMTQQFAQQDAIIGQLDQQMKALQMQIDAQYAKK